MWHMTVSIILAVLCGGAIGLEREYQNKPAGLRTLILICLGSTLFTLVSQSFGDGSDPTRIAAQIVTGIGFLGAGVILHSQMKVHGLTTAASVWVTAAIGMAIGAQLYVLAIGCTVLIFLLLSPLQRLERIMERKHRLHVYDIRFQSDAMPLDTIRRLIQEANLKIKDMHYHQKEGEYRIHLALTGSPENNQLWLHKTLSLPEIKEIAQLGLDEREE